MKAFNYYQYGTPEVLQLEEVPIPQSKPTEVLIQIHALSLNPAEWHLLTASFRLLRLSAGWSAPKKPNLGADVAGTVVEVGSEVTRFQKGDRVFGRGWTGCLAEYSCLEESALASIPEGLSDEQAAATALAGVTALIALRNKGKLQAGEHVLIHGASGGIGTFVIQLAKQMGAQVTGVCSTPNIELIQSLGVDTSVDYKKQDLLEMDAQFDVIIDLVGNYPIAGLFKLLRPRGRCVLVGMDRPARLFSNLFRGTLLSLVGNKKAIPMDAQVTPTDLEYLAGLIVKGTLRPVIDQMYDFASLPEAFAHLGTRRSKGKLVIRV
jgi:NADPH:quinone reductase-like Zn-dependent oxidoreductase